MGDLGCVRPRDRRRFDALVRRLHLSHARSAKLADRQRCRSSAQRAVGCHPLVRRELAQQSSRISRLGSPRLVSGPARSRLQFPEVARAARARVGYTNAGDVADAKRDQSRQRGTSGKLVAVSWPAFHWDLRIFEALRRRQLRRRETSRLRTAASDACAHVLLRCASTVSAALRKSVEAQMCLCGACTVEREAEDVRTEREEFAYCTLLVICTSSINTFGATRYCTRRSDRYSQAA